MDTMAENVITAGAGNRPHMLEKGMYDSWKPRIWLYIKRRENGDMLIDSIENGPFQFKKEIIIPATDGAPEQKCEQTLADLSPEENLRLSSGIKATNIILLGLPVDIYTLISHYQTTKEIWDRVKELMEGTKLTLQEHEQSYMMNSIDSHLSPTPSTELDLRFAVPSFLPTNDRIASLNKRCFSVQLLAKDFHQQPINSELHIIQELKKQFRMSHAGGTRGINTVGDVNANQPRVIKCYNCKGKGHITKQCTTKKRVKDDEWFKEKMLLAQAQEAGIILHEEHQDLLADRLEDMDDCNDLQLHTASNFKADHVDAYDSYCDDEATASVIFMASLSPARSINGDTVGPAYDLDILSEVPHYDTYHETNVLNSHV
ncbi:retrovirus-related pol polyprotein from transposon TNT 1-94 [Tanacetum coccineum]